MVHGSVIEEIEGLGWLPWCLVASKLYRVNAPIIIAVFTLYCIVLYLKQND